MTTPPVTVPYCRSGHARLIFFQLAQTFRAEAVNRAVLADLRRVRAELEEELPPREAQRSLEREGAIGEPEVQIEAE